MPGGGQRVQATALKQAGNRDLNDLDGPCMYLLLPISSSLRCSLATERQCHQARDTGGLVAAMFEAWF
jgi:hypothetical protein